MKRRRWLSCVGEALSPMLKGGQGRRGRTRRLSSSSSSFPLQSKGRERTQEERRRRSSRASIHLFNCPHRSSLRKPSCSSSSFSCSPWFSTPFLTRHASLCFLASSFVQSSCLLSSRKRRPASLRNNPSGVLFKNETFLRLLSPLQNSSRQPPESPSYSSSSSSPSSLCSALPAKQNALLSLPSSSPSSSSSFFFFSFYSSLSLTRALSTSSAPSSSLLLARAIRRNLSPFSFRLSFFSSLPLARTSRPLPASLSSQPAGREPSSSSSSPHLGTLSSSSPSSAGLRLLSSPSFSYSSSLSSGSGHEKTSEVSRPPRVSKSLPLRRSLSSSPRPVSFGTSSSSSPSVLPLSLFNRHARRGFTALTRDSVDIVPPLERLEGFLLSNLPLPLTADPSFLLRYIQRAGLRVAPQTLPSYDIGARVDSSIDASSSPPSASSSSSSSSPSSPHEDDSDDLGMDPHDTTAVLVQKSRLGRAVGRCLVLPPRVDIDALGADGCRLLQKQLAAVLPQGAEVAACDGHDVEGYVEEFERYFHLTEDLQRLANPENLRRVVSLSPVPPTYGRREVRDVVREHAGVDVDQRDIVFRFRKDGVQGETCYVLCQSERDAGVVVSRIQETPVPNRVHYAQLFGCSFLWATRSALFLSHPSIDYLPGRSPFQIFTTGWEGDVQESEFANLAYQLRLFPKAVRRFCHPDTRSNSFFLEFHRMRDAKLTMSRLQLLRKRWRLGADSPFFGFVRMADLRFEDEEKFADEDSAADSDLDEPIDY